GRRGSAAVSVARNRLAVRAAAALITARGDDAAGPAHVTAHVGSITIVTTIVTITMVMSITIVWSKGVEYPPGRAEAAIVPRVIVIIQPQQRIRRAQPDAGIIMARLGLVRLV